MTGRLKTALTFGKGVRKMEKVMHFKITDKMADIISESPSILQIMSRFGMKLGFGDSTVEQVCRLQGVDGPTFISVVNFVSEGGSSPVSDEECGSLSVPTLLFFLKQAHIYFLDFSLPNIKQRLSAAIGCYDHEISRLIMKFFEDYTRHVKQHMMYEECEVFPFVEALINGVREQRFRIASFSKKHSQVSDTLHELKDLIIKYFPARESSNLINLALYDIMQCEKELESHCKIEDYIFVPAVMKLENPDCKIPPVLEKDGDGKDFAEAEEKDEDDQDQTLSIREKDILAEVARGYTNKEIADRLYISIHTVITHRRNIARKLKIHSVAGLTIYAVANNLITIKEIGEFV